MKSPITGSDMKLARSPEELEFRGEKFTIIFNRYVCPDTGEQFTNANLDDLNMHQLYNKYRAKHQIPFPDDMISIREKYGVSQNRMALILGFGQNTYRNYEHGDIPSLSNAKLITLASDPAEFAKLIDVCDELRPGEKEKLIRRSEQLTKEAEAERGVYNWIFVKHKKPDSYNGFRTPSLERFHDMVRFFAAQTQPHKTKLNKLLFYADYHHYQRTARSISGIHYQAIQLGPVPFRYDTLFETGVEQKRYAVEYVIYPDRDFIGEKFILTDLTGDGTSELKEEELKTLSFIRDKLGEKTTRDLIEMSHEEVAWLENHRSNGIMNYELAFRLKHPKESWV